MKYVLMMALLAFTVVSCGNDEEAGKKKEEKPIELKTPKDKWSYYMGYQSTKNILNPQDPNKGQYLQRKGLIIEGFKEGYREISKEELSAYSADIQNMLGGNSSGSTFNVDAADAGCKGMGIITAYQSYMNFKQFGPTSIINLDKMIAGFTDGINEKPNRVSDEEFQSFQSTFNDEIERLSALKAAEVEAEFKPRWEEIKAIEGIQELDKGIYLETLKKGTGGKPSVGDDIEASYILREFDGTLKETSEKLPDGKFQANLAPGSLIEGWVIGFQSMQVGGKYKLYVPSESAYKIEPLEFEIEFFQKGPAGSLAQPRGPRR